MLSPVARILFTLLVGFVVAPAAAAAGPYDDLLKAASPNANVLVIVNPTAAYASPLGKAEKWAERGKKNEHGSLGFVPPEAELVVISSEVNLTSMTRDFQLGLMKLRGGVPNMKTLAGREGGTMDEIAGRLVVSSPRDAYFTSVSEAVFVAAFPADRQYTARWARHAHAAKESGLVPYLKKAADDAGDNVLVVAMDLDEAFDPTRLRMGLAVSPVLVTHKGLDLTVLAKRVAGAKGLIFAAKVTDTITGTIRIDFRGDPTQYKRVMRDLFLELIDAYGVAFAGMDKWETTYTDTSMTLTGPLTGADLQRALSLFAFPSGSASESNPAGKDDGATPAATRRYLDAVSSILKDIRSMKDSPNYTKTATWHDKAAAQIDQISRRNVDPLAASAASDAARRLRAISGSLRGVPIDLDSLSQQGYFYAVSGGAVGGWGWGGRTVAYGAPSISTNLPEVQAASAKVIADDQKKRLDLWNQIDQLMSDAQRKLMDKYKGGF